MDKNQKFNQVISNIFRVNSKIRYVSIIDLDGRIIASEMKSDLQSLLKKTNEEKFCEHVAIRRRMRHEFDKKLGKVNFIHVERENITQLVLYSKSYSFFITIEPEITSNSKSKIVTKAKKIVSTLK
jgi:hypothetical protein|uniref:Roadblock/LAMTOR2 domain-containing protein n=1 Tax=uncultured marine thaumarchaeote KM3_69_B11 TaxID=1456244 RepID=A0A075HET3_9ARCH|nr:hypothetical protein [uncultured marine thaumarchaeote KM3_69_B11]|tara:strand:- start:1900 stop:2277 length:378 start_codon:yes stop_codon:yes gene_type:complete